MIKKKKLYVKPKKSYESSRIKEENDLVAKYGLKNKREIWKTLAKVNYFRRRAMELAKHSPEEQEILINKLRNLGLDIDALSDILDLKIENLLDRRFQTIVFKKGLANTPKQARQFITHKKVSIKRRVMNSPSYLVPLADEKEISVSQQAKQIKEKQEPMEKEEIKEAA